MSRTFTRVVLAALLQAGLIAMPSAAADAGILYGTDYLSVNGRSGLPVSSDVEIGRNGYFGAYCSNGAEPGDRRIVYPFDIPKGFEIFGVRVWGVDDSTSHDLSYKLIESCQPFLGGGVPTHTTLASAASNGNGGQFSQFLFASQQVTQGSTCAYYLEARFADNATACDSFNLISTRVRILVNDPDVIFRSSFATWGS